MERKKGEYAKRVCVIGRGPWCKSHTVGLPYHRHVYVAFTATSKFVGPRGCKALLVVFCNSGHGTVGRRFFGLCSCPLWELGGLATYLCGNLKNSLGVGQGLKALLLWQVCLGNDECLGNVLMLQWLGCCLGALCLWVLCNGCIKSTVSVLRD
jgi:hypothetical protein